MSEPETTSEEIEPPVEPAPVMTVEMTEKVQRTLTAVLNEPDIALGFPTVGHLRKFLEKAEKLPDEALVRVDTGLQTGGTITAEWSTVEG